MFVLSILLVVFTTQKATSPPVATHSVIPQSILPAPPAPNHVVATVNGVPLAAGEVESMIWEMHHEEVEQDFIDYFIIRGAADAAKVAISEEEVQSNMGEFLTTFRKGLPAGTSISAALKAKGFSDSRLYLRLKTQLLLNKLQLKDLHPSSWASVSTLIFPTPNGKPEIVKDAAAKALDAYAKLQKGASWDALLGQLTTRQKVLEDHGSIGWHSVDKVPKLVRDQLVTLKQGQFTRPEQTATGIQIFRLDKRGADATGKDLKALQQSYLDSTRAEYVRQLRQKAKITRT